MPRCRKSLTFCLLATVVGGLSSRPAAAQVSRGFDQIARAFANGEERNRQSDFRVMEVQLKPMRMLWVDITNPKTGQKEKKLVWYLVWRSLTRPSPARTDDSDTKPVNVVDAAPKPVMLMPEAILETYDDPAKPVPLKFHHDVILPEALAAIRAVEQRPAGMFQKRKIEDTVSVVQPFPDAIAEDAAPEQQDWIYGVFMFTDVDPDTDYFEVMMRGFSNGYDASKTGPDGNLQPWRKVLVQKFVRRGDRFDPSHREFEFSGEPEWTYQPDETQWGQWAPAQAAQPATTK